MLMQYTDVAAAYGTGIVTTPIIRYSTKISSFVGSLASLALFAAKWPKIASIITSSVVIFFAFALSACSHLSETKGERVVSDVGPLREYCSNSLEVYRDAQKDYLGCIEDGTFIFYNLDNGPELCAAQYEKFAVTKRVYDNCVLKETQSRWIVNPFNRSTTLIYPQP